MEKDYLSIKKIVKIYENNQRVKSVFQKLSIRVLLQPTCIGELSEIFNLL